MFGGDCCNPMAWRKIDSTVTMNGKQVIMIASPGTMLSSVIRMISCMLRAASDPSSPSEIEISWAAAGAANNASQAAMADQIRIQTRRLNGSQPVGQIGNLGQPHCKLPGVFAVKLLQFTARDELVAHV